MKDELKEQLSALIDDELSAEEIELLIRRLPRSPDSVEQLSRYFLIRDALHRDLPLGNGSELSGRVAAALETEQVHDTEPAWDGGGQVSRHVNRLLRPVAGVAIAASVALVGVVIWPRGGSDDVMELSETRELAAELSSPASSDLDSSGEVSTGAEPASDGARFVADMPEPQRWEQLSPGVRQRLNGYLVNHSEHSSMGQLGGMMIYMRIAGNEGEE